jgi:sec-independent protein translocase protein TatC
MISTVALFLAGGYFGYKLVYPQALEFLIGYGKQFQPMITIGEYTNLFLTIIIGMGVIFEMPILVFFLSLMGIVSAGWMWRNLRYSILVIFIIAAIITPTTDILNMCRWWLCTWSALRLRGWCIRSSGGRGRRRRSRRARKTQGPSTSFG